MSPMIRSKVVDPMDSPRVKRALISVSDKLGLAGFARGLADAEVEIYSTGGTRKFLESQGLAVHDVSEYTQFPEVMNGRVKTLHPKVFGGILCRHDRIDDMATIDEHDIVSFELVVVNLYPFEATISREDVTDDEAIEQIDIGGPSLVRAAAKNHRFTTIATNPEQYSVILREIQAKGCTSYDLRRRLAGEAFARTADYDRAITDYFHGEVGGDEFPLRINLSLQRKSVLRYGENPHQKAAVYRQEGARGASVINARQLNGKELSYNNLLDLDSALNMVRLQPAPAASVIKHNNPCGAATASTLAEAAQKAMDGDPLSAFGSVIGFNRTVDVATAEVLAAPGLFVEAIVAPDFEAAAVGVLTTRPKWKNNVRLMQVGRIVEPPSATHLRPIEGGMLVQQADILPDLEQDWEIVTEQDPEEEIWRDMQFGWDLVRHVKSNAIVICRDQALVGVGAGQMSRVDSVEIALEKAGDRAKGAVLASDAFFPFPDSIHRAAQAGITTIVQPGGSRRDNEVIEACDQHGIAMVFTELRHFKH